MRWSPHVTVAAVIPNDAGRFLLVEESPDGTPVFNQPAGHLELGETLLEAVIREVREETCRAFTPKGLTGVYQWTSPKGQTYLRFCFHGSVGRTLHNCQLDPDITATHWLNLEQMQSGACEMRSPLVLQCLHDHAAGRHIPLDSLKSLA